MKANHKKIGTESQSWWWSNSAKADSQSSDPRVHNPVECSKAKVVENYQYTSALMRRRLKQFFRTIISVSQLSICGAVSDSCEEYKFRHVTTERPVFGNTIWPNVCAHKRDENTYTFDRWFLRKKKICCKSTKNGWTSCHNKIVWLNCVLIQDSWQRLMSDSTSWQKTLKNCHNLQSQGLVVSTLCQEMKNHLTR